jgi:hypothetical protein
MADKLMMLAGFGTGHVLGARAGREPYDEIACKAPCVNGEGSSS